MRTTLLLLVSLVAVSRVSSEDADDDDEYEDFQVSFQTAASMVDKTKDDDIGADVSGLIQEAASLVQSGDDVDADASDECDESVLMQNVAGSVAKTVSSDQAKQHAGHKLIVGISARAEQLEKSMGQAAGQSLELQGLQTILAYMEHFWNMLRVKVHEVPLAFGIVGIGLVILGLALAVMIICANMKGQVEYVSIDGEEEVWEKIGDCSPEKAHERKLVKLFEELVVGNRSAETPPGCITAVDLQNMMKDRQVAKELSELGISTNDSMAVFNLLARKSNDASVNLEEFVSGCMSSEGRLLRLFNELHEANQSDGYADSPLGCITANDLEFAMQDQRVAKEFTALGISPADSWAVFRVLETTGQQDRNMSGERFVSLQDFMAGCKKVNKYGSMQKPHPSGQSVRSGSSYTGSVRAGSVI